MANFLSEAARSAVHGRLANPEPHQTLDEDRLYCDLLSSMPMCFNLFGPLQHDLALADRAVRAWWPSVPGRVRAVRFEWSPGRRLPGQYLENRSAFDVAFELELENGARGVLGVETKYHEACLREPPPSDARRSRYSEVARRSGVFLDDAIAAFLGSDLQQIWLDHLLALSMKQHSAGWKWAGFVLVHPLGNPSYASAAARYIPWLVDRSSFIVTSIEPLLDARVLPERIARDFRERYIW